MREEKALVENSWMSLRLGTSRKVPGYQALVPHHRKRGVGVGEDLIVSCVFKPSDKSRLELKVTPECSSFQMLVHGLQVEMCRQFICIFTPQISPLN